MHLTQFKREENALVFSDKAFFLGNYRATFSISQSLKARKYGLKKRADLESSSNSGQQPPLKHGFYQNSQLCGGSWPSVQPVLWAAGHIYFLEHNLLWEWILSFRHVGILTAEPETAMYSEILICKAHAKKFREMPEYSFSERSSC